MTLVEVIVASMLLSLVVIVVGGVWLSVMTTERTVNAVTSAASEGQLVASTIEAGIRNSSGFNLSASSGDQLLVARTVGQGSTLEWSCTAWLYSPADGGSILTTRKADSTVIGMPTAATRATWTTVMTGIEPRSGSTIFTLNDDGTGVTIAFDAEAAGRPPVAIQTTVLPRMTVMEDNPCF